MTNLEQSFADICAKHNLRRLDIGFNLRRYNATCWWDGYSRSVGCEHSSGDTLAEAIADCLTRAAAERAEPIALADEPLPVDA